MILSRHDSVCLAQELGEESPGWPIKCLALPRKLLPVSRGRFITPRQPAGRAVGATRYSNVCYMLPLAQIWVPCFGRSWTIWKHKGGRPRPPGRLFETGAHALRPRQPGLRPDPGGDRAGLENRPAPHAHAGAHHR